MTTRALSEHVHQAKLVGRVRNFYRDVIIFSVPNGGQRDAREGARLKAEGVLAGVPDLVIAEPRGRYHGLYLEMKREDGDGPRPNQLEMLQRLTARGYKAVIGYGVEHAWTQVEEYLALPEWPDRS